MDYYGCRLATCSSDRSVRIYDVKGGTQTLTADLRGHEGPVSNFIVNYSVFKFTTIYGMFSRYGKLLGLTLNLETF